MKLICITILVFSISSASAAEFKYDRQFGHRVRGGWWDDSHENHDDDSGSGSWWDDSSESDNGCSSSEESSESDSGSSSSEEGGDGGDDGPPPVNEADKWYYESKDCSVGARNEVSEFLNATPGKPYYKDQALSCKKNGQEVCFCEQKPGENPPLNGITIFTATFDNVCYKCTQPEINGPFVLVRVMPKPTPAPKTTPKPAPKPTP